MPRVSIISKEEICKQHALLGMLMLKCKSCKLFAEFSKTAGAHCAIMRARNTLQTQLFLRKEEDPV